MKHQCKLINVLNIGIGCFWFLAALLVGLGLSSNPAEAQPFAYVSGGREAVSVIDLNPTSTDYNKVVATIEEADAGIMAITPDGTRAYMMNPQSGTVSVIDTNPSSTDFNKVIAKIEVGGMPFFVAITPDGTRAYLAGASPGFVSVMILLKNPVFLV